MGSDHDDTDAGVFYHILSIIIIIIIIIPHQHETQSVDSVILHKRVTITALGRLCDFG
jgi:hypothetical protein